jgi:hypothetical protein
VTEQQGEGNPAEHDIAPDAGQGSGDPRVAGAVERLDELTDLPPAEHVEVYESVHRVLQESLAEAQADRADG